jgi:death-on-curing protein
VNEVAYLELDDLLRLTQLLGAGPVRDFGLLDAAAHRPRSTAFGQEIYSTLSLKAAALMHSIVRTHPLVDGNKRLGWIAAVVFLDINGVTVSVTDDQAFELTMTVARGDVALDIIASGLVG